jgi:hypothetical protein
MINEGANQGSNENKIYSSPWNIATQFKVDMAFSPNEISVMLDEYEANHNNGMNITEITEEIYKYTSGYPFLVSRICQCIDEEINKNWTKNGMQIAINILLQEENVLFDDLIKNIENNKELYDFLYTLLMVGVKKPFNIDDPIIKLSSMYGYIKSSNGNTHSGGYGDAVIHNKIFEMRMSNYFISKDTNAVRIKNAVTPSLLTEVIKDGRFNLELVLRKFAEHYKELFAEKDLQFLEHHGRLLFISFLRPLINGRGFYHIESQFTDLRRMDLVVDFGTDQFIIELSCGVAKSINRKHMCNCLTI